MVIHGSSRINSSNLKDWCGFYLPNIVFITRAHGSKTQLPQLEEINAEAEIANVNDHMQELSLNETEDINQKEVEGTCNS